MYKKIFILTLFVLYAWKGFAQVGSGNTNVIQFSGFVMTDQGSRPQPVPFATIGVVGTTRGTYANYKGFFSLAVRKGDKIQFSCIGMETTTTLIPDTLTSNRYAVIQLMTADEVNLPELVIFPWPNRDHFKNEFLAMDVRNELLETAKANLAADRIAGIRESMAMDGAENGKYVLQQNAARNYWIGQTPPMPIFNPMAWAKFLANVRDGKYKKKKKE